MSIEKGTAVPAGWRRALVLALVISLVLPAGAHAQSHRQELPGLVSGKKIAILAAIAGGAVFALIWLHKRSQQAPNPSLTQERLEFGAVPVGTAADQLITVVNTTNEPLIISRVVVAGRSFALISSLALPLVLAPNTQTGVRVSFDPLESRLFKGRMEIQTAAASAGVRTSQVVLTGKGA